MSSLSSPFFYFLSLADQLCWSPSMTQCAFNLNEKYSKKNRTLTSVANASISGSKRGNKNCQLYMETTYLQPISFLLGDM